MLKVAHLMAGARAGGAELFYERLTIAQARHDIAVLAAIRSEPARAARLLQGGLQPLQFPFGGRLDLLTRPRLRRALRSFEPRVTVAWMNRAARLAPRGDWVLAGRLGGFYDLDYYRNCDHLVGNTHGIVDWIVRQGWPASRVHHLPNFSADYATRHLARAPAGEPSRLLALGRLHRNKGFDVLIRAMAMVPDATLLIAGEGPERGALETLARDCKVSSRVKMPGWHDDTASLLASCDLLVCPSRHEPLGNVIIEAFSASLPVVAARAQGPVELIEDGVSGKLVALEDAAALAGAIRALLANPDQAARLAAAGRGRYEQDFAEAPVLARWREFLTGVEKA